MECPGFRARAGDGLGGEWCPQVEMVADQAQGSRHFLEELSQHHPTVMEWLDEGAKHKLTAVSLDRAMHILQEVITKGNVQNPSAFVMRSVDMTLRHGSSRDEEELLGQYPALRDALDQKAKQMLLDADPGRALEILEDVAGKSDVRNPSAFVVSSLTKYPRRRGPPSPDDVSVDVARDLQGPLPEYYDDSEWLEQNDQMEFAGHPHMKSPSAFALRALPGPQRFAELRGVVPFSDASSPGECRGFGGPGPQHVSLADRTLALCPKLQAALDEPALVFLRAADPGRAVEIIFDLAAAGHVRNPSAFVTRALASRPMPRDVTPLQPVPPPREDSASAARQRVPKSALQRASASVRESCVEAFLRRYPSIHSALDSSAVFSLESVEPERALEILQDIVAKGDVRNPSAFVSRAVHCFPTVRGRAVHASVGPNASRVQGVASTELHPLPHSECTRRRRGAAALPSVEALRGHPRRQDWNYDTKRSRFTALPHAEQHVFGSQRNSCEPSSWGQDAIGVDLDANARAQVASADPARAAEILEELHNKGSQVRNPSAFVANALRKYPSVRGRRLD